MAILPVVSFLGPLAANLLTGSIVVESIFNIPGAGGFFVNSIQNRDGFLLGGVVIVYCALLVVMNLVVDLLTWCWTGGSGCMTETPGIWERLWRRRVARAALIVLAVDNAGGDHRARADARRLGRCKRESIQPAGMGASVRHGPERARRALPRAGRGARLAARGVLRGADLVLRRHGVWLVAGYAGGRTDAGMMRAVEILYSIPRLIIILIFINAFDTHLKNWMAAAGLDGLVADSRIVILILCLGLIEWLTMARIVRGQVLALKAQQFVAAAQALGQSHFKILTRHLLPNLLGIIVVYLTLTVPAVILDESFLSFLGLGIQAPQASWGSLLADGAEVINPIRSNWWLLVFPALAMCVTLLALEFPRGCDPGSRGPAGAEVEDRSAGVSPALCGCGQDGHAPFGK